MINNKIKFYNFIKINKNNKKNKFILKKNNFNKCILYNLIKLKKSNIINFNVNQNNLININFKFYENKIIFQNKWK